MQMTKKTVTVLRFNDGAEQTLDEFETEQLRQLLGHVDADWRVLALRGLKIDAIKRLRTLTGAGLKEAKDAVERFVLLDEGGEAQSVIAQVRALPTPTPPAPPPSADRLESYTYERKAYEDDEDVAEDHPEWF